MYKLNKELIFLVLFNLLTINSGYAYLEINAPPINLNDHYDNGIGTSEASSQGVVEKATLNDMALLRPGEVLEVVPGLVVTQHSGEGKANQYFLRGYNLDHGTDFASFLDGVPVNMPTNAHGQGYCDINYLIPELVDHIDYRKGPYFTDSGDFSSAGSAHIQYQNSLNLNIANITLGSFGIERFLFAGSTQLQFNNQESIFGNLGPILLGAVDITRNNGPWAVKEDLQRNNLLLRLSDGSSLNGWSIDGVVYNASWNSTDQVPLALINSGQLGRYSSLDPTDGGNTDRQIVSGEWHDIDKDGYIKITTYLEHYNLQLWSNFSFYELRPSTGDQFEQVENRNFVGGNIIKGWNNSLFNFDSTNEIGLQLREDNIHVSLLNTQARIPFETVSNDRVNETSLGLYLQNMTVWNNWFRSLVGLREDSLIINMTSYSQAQNSGSSFNSKFSPKASFIFGPWNSTELFFNLGKGFHSNDARGVIDKVDPTTGNASVAVPALVGSSGKEIGLRTEVIQNLQSSIAFWTLDSDSEIVYNADSDIGSSSPNAASKRYGVEWDNHWITNDQLFIDADLAWTHARYAIKNANGETGDLIPNAVGKVALLRATCHNFYGWSAGLETRFVGPSPLTQDGSLMAPSSLVTNLRLNHSISNKVTASIDILNLFNTKYYDIAYQQDYQISPTSPVVPNGVTVHPGEPLQFRVTLKFNY